MLFCKEIYVYFVKGKVGFQLNYWPDGNVDFKSPLIDSQRKEVSLSNHIYLRSNL